MEALITEQLRLSLITEQLRLPLLSDYTVRISQRAKRAQIHVSQEGRVEVVIPRSFNPARVPKFVANNQAWLDQALHHIQAQQVKRKQSLPHRIHLRAIDEHWQVSYRHSRKPRSMTTLECEQRGLLDIFSGTEKDSRTVLAGWLTSRAKETLVPWLNRLSIDLDLPFRKAIVRAQKTCWGSCSPSHTISLNRSLLFLPVRVVNYLLVHELCHTVYGNHSPQYWQLVARFEPAYEKLDAKLLEAGRHVPAWAASN